MRPSLPDVIAQLGGVATRAQLRARGFSPFGLTRAVRAGVVLRLRRSRYALLETDEPTRVAIALGGVLGGLSAARTYSWWTGLDRRIHVSWPAHGNVAKPGRIFFGRRPEVVHHWRILRGSGESRSLTREPPLETLAQVLISSSREIAVACADSAIRSGTLTDHAVRALFRRMPARVAAWECFLDGRSDSGLESIVRIWLMDRGIPFTLHARVAGVGVVDFLIGGSLIIETDGRRFHDDPDAADRDGRRDTEAGIRGHVTVRIRYRMLLFDRRRWQRRILEHLARGDHLRPVSPA